MSSIYGWFEPNNSNRSNRFSYPPTTDSQSGLKTVSCKTRTLEMGGYGNNTAPSIYESDRLISIIEGSPDWNDSELSRISKNQSPAKALSEGFKRYGKSVLDKIRGPFAFCILEPDNHYALLAIDRLGIRPLAFAIRENLLVFGSQLDQIIAHPVIKPEISSQAIFDYLYFHMIPSPGCIYKDITKLQPGEFLEFTNGQAKLDFYWQISYTDSNDSKSTLIPQLHEQLKRSVADCAPDQHTGAFLSGGLDSSTVAGVYQEISKARIDAFSIGFDAKGYDEMEYARATSGHFNINLHEYYVTPSDVLKAIPLIAQTYDEPFGNASAIPTYYCAKFARENGMNLLLAGDGGDEIFAGNSRYAKQKIFNLYHYVPELLKTVLEPIASGISPLRKVESYIKQAKIPMPDRLETYNFLHRAPLDEIFSDAFLKQVTPETPLNNIRETYSRSPTDDLVKSMLFLDGKITLADNDLRKVNRMCELAGIDVRYPMLNESLVDFAASIPSKWLLKGFELRSFYRQALRDFLAKETLSKSKQGFGLPFGVWMDQNKELKQFAEANLQGIEKRGFINPEYIKMLIQLHREGHSSYYGVMIWILVMLEQWFLEHNM